MFNMYLKNLDTDISQECKIKSRPVLDYCLLGTI